MQLTVRGQAFNRGDLVGLMHDGKRQAGIDADAIHVKRASPTLPMVAAFLRAGEVKMFAKSVKKSDSRLDGQLMLLAVNFQSNRCVRGHTGSFTQSFAFLNKSLLTSSCRRLRRGRPGAPAQHLIHGGDQCSESDDRQEEVDHAADVRQVDGNVNQ